MLRGINPSFFDFSEPRRFAEILSKKYSDNGNPIYDSDEFRMYTFKIKKCSKTRSHDWTECPFAHRGEKARRRDPRKIHYSGVACPEFRIGDCKKGESCEYAHGIFEFWLHPSRYRTRLCNAGRFCQRKVCFFAHTVEQLRLDSVKYSLLKCNFLNHTSTSNGMVMAAAGSSNGIMVNNFVENSGGGKKIMVTTPIVLMRNNHENNLMREHWDDFLESLRGLRIGSTGTADIVEGGRNFGFEVTDVPDIDWVSELVD